MEQKQQDYSGTLVPPAPVYNKDDEIDLRELFSALWKGKWIIIISTMLFAALSVFYAISQPNVYKSDALLAPAESSNGGGLTKMAGQLGGLAALAGVNIGGSESSKTDLAVQVMRSRKFVDDFIKTHELLVPLMAAKGWDLSTNKLLLDEELYDAKLNKWLRNPKGLRGSEPSAQEAYQVFMRDVFKITEDKESGLYTVSIMHYSPYIAQQWVNWLVDDINTVMRQRAISESTQNLNYLNTQLQKTSVADMQSTFYKLIEEQTKSLMLAEVQDEFVFKLIDPAVVSEQKAKPNRALICVLGTLLGGIVGVGIVLIMFVIRKRQN
ncbi:Wzz/FepE/Etk N-terminal domain-containing protein [Vibrio owensii]|uniref:Wzz/FepE/Etk N-terminal domain-containing protein n=1 Tax=Vibrio owensii TaxID=696485 RepID=UPI003AAC533A